MYAVVGVGAVHAELLCVGADGHVAFAGPAGDDRCHGESTPSDTSGVQAARIADRAASADCTDLVLPGRTALKIQEPGLEVGPLVLARVIAAIAPTAVALPKCAPTVDVGASLARTLTSHRTTILLI
ncbi:hypothetical protein [Tautonia sociabilis]|uniref:hypothetical protein n=1 Tax=Tautonia sociabilis TaxID=2080755 RepID=UPI001F2A7C1D|nr:hypothetical protein [Tautonia sociabilis]